MFLLNYLFMKIKNKKIKSWWFGRYEKVTIATKKWLGGMEKV
jgi:hypothetical protein